MKNIPASLFRAYDIRGRVDHDLTVDAAYAIGRALGTVARRAQQDRIVVARDGRLSGPVILDALKKGLMDTGLQLMDIGQVPTPVLYFATYALDIPTGVMVTASHNPADYNGMKMVVAGHTLSGDAIRQLYHMIVEQDFLAGEGECRETTITEEYMRAIQTKVVLARPLNIVIDAGNGIAGAVAPTLFQRLGCKVTSLFCEVDGHFPHHHPDPTVEANLATLKQTVLDVGADVGLAFDGDADRLGIVTNTGQSVVADRQMMLFAKSILATHPGATIVYDVKCSWHLPRVIRAAGGHPMMCKTGHSFVKATLKKEQAIFAGEMSGHLFFADNWYGFDDALFAGARLLQILASQTLSCAELFQQFPESVSTPEIKVPIAEEKKFDFIRHFVGKAQFPDATLNTLDGLRVEYPDGWGLLRASNTSPNVILRFEAEDDAVLQRIRTAFETQMRAIDSSLL